MGKFVTGPKGSARGTGSGVRGFSACIGTGCITRMSELTPTPNDCALPLRRADFATLNEAIDYAALSEKGLNFHDARGALERAYPYRELRDDAVLMARRL